MNIKLEFERIVFKNGCYLPSSLDHLFPIKSSPYVSPVIMYFPVSPVAPPNKITFDFDTTDHIISLIGLYFTLCYRVSKSSKRYFSKYFNLRKHFFDSLLCLMKNLEWIITSIYLNSNIGCGKTANHLTKIQHVLICYACGLKKL